MTVSETIAPGRGIMIATRREGTPTVNATIAEEAAAAVTVVVVAEAGAGAKTVSETVTETGIETGTGIEIAPGAGPSAELGREAGVENETLES